LKKIEFAKDLLVEPSSRGASDVMHILAGVGSSSSKSKAQEFINKVDAQKQCDAFGNYEDLARSTNIDVVYIATPHSHHFSNAMLALQSGRHVLCEKPLTVNAEQARRLVTVATKNNLFLMEGMWTRFQPIGVEIRRLIEESAVGTITRVFADNSLGMDPLTDFPAGDRMVSKILAGGALLDCEYSTVDEEFVLLTKQVGPYSIQWVIEALPKERRRPLKVFSVVSRCHDIGVDESAGISMKFSAEDGSKPELLGLASVSLRAADDYDGRTPVVRFQGDKGEIQIFGRPWRPSHLRVIQRDQGFGSKGTHINRFENYIPQGNYGLSYEADEVARCIRDGELESTIMPWNDSLIIMEIMDRVRSDNELDFPDNIESAENGM
jgi:predicted dehydrogenase